MTWTKLYDGFWMHPKVMMCGNAGAGIFTRLLSYCGAYLTDGAVPSFVVTQIVGTDQPALERLEQAGMVSILESGGVEILDYLEYQRSKAQVKADLETKRANGSKGGRPRRLSP